MGSCDTLRLNTLLINFECTGKESISDLESNFSILNRGKEPFINLRLGFVLKPGCVPQDSTIGMGMDSRFRFSLFKNGS